MKNKVVYNIDKIRCSFNCPPETYNYIAEATGVVSFDGFILQIISTEDNDEDDVTKITAKCILCNGIELGVFTFNKSKYNGLAFFRFTNAALYTLDGYDGFAPDRKKINQQFYLTWVSEKLRLTFKSFTELEIALDCNHNVGKRLQSLMRKDGFDVYKNRVKVKNKKETIQDAKAISPINCYGLLPKHSLYFKSKKKDIELKLYDKSFEIEEKGEKNYIEEWNQMGKIYRTEISIEWPKFKEILDFITTTKDYNFPEEWKRYISPNEGEPHASPSEPYHEYLERMYMLLQDDQFIATTFSYFTDKTLYLRNGNEKWSIMDIAYSFN